MLKICALSIFEDGLTKEVEVKSKTINDVNVIFADTKDDTMSFDSSCAVRFEIGLPNGNGEYLSDSKYNAWWRQPFFGKTLDEFPEEAQYAIFKLNDGKYIVILPVVSNEYKCVLSNSKIEGNISAKVYSGYSKMNVCKTPAFVYAIGENPYCVMEKCVKIALEVLDNGTKHISRRKFPEIFEYLGWCSWDSMQIRVCESGVIEKCEELKNKKIPVKWAIFDDMWAEVTNFYGKEYSSFREMVVLMHESPLDSFEADPKRFPNGLASTIEKVKRYGMKVGMWYPTIGYWHGISKNGEAYNQLKDYLIKNIKGWNVPDWKEDNAYLYYKKINEFLKESGADFVKVDRQSICEFEYTGYAPVGTIATEYHKGLERSVKEIFDSRMINCMGMASEDIWSRSDSPISRCSEDFQPENREWFSKHILQCAYNSIMLGQFYWCDWDMWWTDDSQAQKNSVMRAISGGPIYVSDMIGRSNKKILDPLVLSDGKILRCDRCAVPTIDCITQNATISGEAIKIQNVAGECGVIAALNIDKDNRPVKVKISGRMVDGFCAEEYGVYEHFSKELIILKGDESFETVLSDNDDFKLYIFVPLKNGNGVIGRTDKFISPKTLCYVDGDIKFIEDGPCAYIENHKLIIKD